MTRCFHCHEPVPTDVRLSARVGDGERPVCCIGCRAAAEWIETQRVRWECLFDVVGEYLEERR